MSNFINSLAYFAHLFQPDCPHSARVTYSSLPWRCAVVMQKNLSKVIAATFAIRHWFLVQKKPTRVGWVFEKNSLRVSFLEIKLRREGHALVSEVSVNWVEQF